MTKITELNGLGVLSRIIGGLMLTMGIAFLGFNIVLNFPEPKLDLAIISVLMVAVGVTFKFSSESFRKPKKRQEDV